MLKRIYLSIFVLAVVISSSCTSEKVNATKTERTSDKPDTVRVRDGDPAARNGSATVRREHRKSPDDPLTTNDERNDQPLGDYGTVTLRVRNLSSGNSYSVDADVDEDEFGELRLRRLYFVKGGWVDFIDCGLESDYSGSCSDEAGKDWEIEGEG